MNEFKIEYKRLYCNIPYDYKGYQICCSILTITMIKGLALSNNIENTLYQINAAYILYAGRWHNARSMTGQRPRRPSFIKPALCHCPQLVSVTSIDLLILTTKELRVDTAKPWANYTTRCANRLVYNK